MEFKKGITKIINLFIVIEFLFYPSIPLWAEDYPEGYLGSGYREYLSGKIQNGYYVEVFTKMDMRQKERVDKRNQVEGILNYSYQATPESTNGILAAEYQHKDSIDKLNTEIKQQRQQREQVATAQTEFNYIKYSDGKVAYFKDSLTTRVENERVVDEFGNVSIKNTYDMQYNDKRLLTSYEATQTDHLGNASRLYWYGVSYTPDSVFYANKDTRAGKNVTDYYLKEIDSAGNTKLTHWQASSYEGKFLRAFSQTIEDSIYGTSTFTRSNITYENNDSERASSYHEEGIGTDGLAYTLERTNINYNDKEQVTGYQEETITTQIDGSKTKTKVDAKFKYLAVANQFGADVEEPDPDKPLESTITRTIENADGSQRTETSTTTYNYDATNQLMGASEQSEFTGQEAQWYEYTDIQGHILSMNKDENGNITYSYIDPGTLEVVAVPVDVVITTLKDGNKYTGISETQYEIVSGKPMTKQTHSKIFYYGQNISADELLHIEDSTIINNNGLVNNLQRLLSSQEHTQIIYPLLDPENIHQEIKDINTTYSYDTKGNLMGAQGIGQGGGWEYSNERGWAFPYSSTITVDYEVILGKALRKLYSEDKHYE
jgi:hypothetical protein